MQKSESLVFNTIPDLGKQPKLEPIKVSKTATLQQKNSERLTL